VAFEVCRIAVRTRGQSTKFSWTSDHPFAVARLTHAPETLAAEVSAATTVESTSASLATMEPPPLREPPWWEPPPRETLLAMFTERSVRRTCQSQGPRWK